MVGFPDLKRGLVQNNYKYVIAVCLCLSFVASASATSSCIIGSITYCTCADGTKEYYASASEALRLAINDPTTCCYYDDVVLKSPEYRGYRMPRVVPRAYISEIEKYNNRPDEVNVRFEENMTEEVIEIEANIIVPFKMVNKSNVEQNLTALFQSLLPLFLPNWFRISNPLLS